MLSSSQPGIFLPEWFVWIVGLLLLPGIGWCIFMAGRVRGIHHKLDLLQKAEEKLIHMHEHSDRYGFGTGGMKELITENVNADERWDEAHEHFYAYYAVPMYYNAWSHRRISDKLKQEERFPMKLAGAMSA